MEPVSDRGLWNEDLAPTPVSQRTWTRWHVASLWVGMAVCIPTWMMAADMVKAGMSVAQSLVTVALGNLVVLIPMVLGAHPGTRYGIPFPVFARAAFGVRGANFAALARALVACGWFGIQTWIGGGSIYAILSVAGIGGGEPLAVLGINSVQLLCFLAFWLVNVFFIWRGIESIKWLEALAAPFLLVGGTALLVWAWSTHGTGAMFDAPGLEGAALVRTFGPFFTAMVAFWGTLALNIPDFSRFCRSQRDQIIGQSIALPTTMTYFAFIGAAVSSATGIWDPSVLVAGFSAPVVVVVGLLGLAVATLSTNIAANVVSPANDFSNLVPGRIDYKLGGYITAAIGVVIMPWKLTNNYVFGWLGGYGALLGPICGVLIVDYWIIRRRVLVVDDLYRRGGIYEYTSGWNRWAVNATLLGIAPNLPGFLHAVALVDSVPAIFDQLYAYNWFVGFAVGAVVYFVGMRRR
ncbi:MAG: NCS1 family nucleobase:cation symporter-1 [Deltaproteobacteria bacterium]|nr:NCS1 family nucleobase:cation symporter-1 [Nannocystaceae bacterium]